MSDDFLETIWAQYAIETEEHIESIESMLIKADAASLNAEEVSGLFRAFHSLKGLSRVMELAALESITHRSEDLLGLVREGRAVLDKNTVDLLLRSLDAIKRLCDQAVAERVDGEKPMVLLLELERAFKTIGQGQLLSAVETAIPTPTTAEPAAEALQPPLWPPCEAASTSAEKTAAPTAGQPFQPENRQMVFFRLISNGVPILERWAKVMASDQHGVELLRVSQDIEKPLSWMLTAANTSGYAGLGLRLEDILVSLPTSETTSQDGIVRMVDAMVAFLLDLKILGETHGVDMGGDAIAKVLKRSLKELSLQLLAQVEGLLSAQASPSPADSKKVPCLLTRLFCRIHGYLALLYPRPHTDVPMLLVETMARAEGHELSLGREGVALCTDAVQLIRECLGSSNPRPLQQNELKTAEGHLLQRIRQHLRAMDGNGNSQVDNAVGMLLGELGSAPDHPIAPSEADAKPAPKALSPVLEQAKPAANLAESEKPVKPVAGHASSNVIRVPGEMLDQFMNQIGEMVLVRGQLAHIIGDPRVREGITRLRETQEDALLMSPGLLLELQKLTDNLDSQLRRLQETDALIQVTLSRFQESVMGLRVVPVELVFKRFPRMVRDLALAQGKNIRLELIGQEVKIDKAMVESLADPLLHMVRNSADHGVESPEARRIAGKPDEAIIRIQAEQQGSRITIRVTDDGKGIDPEQVRRKAIERGLVKEVDSLQMSKEDILGFIFRPAFSTADVVTETSGRGVGMDVVWNSVMRMGGSIRLDSEIGLGTTFTMQMPLSAAVQEVLLVKSSRQTLAIPSRYVVELVEIGPDEYQTVKGRTAILLRGNFLPIVRLDELLGLPCAEAMVHRCVVVISDGQRSLGVSVQAFVGRQELFTKDIHPRLAALPGVGGASILGDGRVVLILDAAALYRLAENLQTSHRLPVSA